MGAVSTAELPDYEVRYPESLREVQNALAIEENVFREAHFLPVESLYERFIPQSTIIGAFTPEGECIGMSRMIGGSPYLPPMLDEEHFEITLEAERWRSLAIDGLVNEWATLAVLKAFRNTYLMIDLCRFSYRDARHLTNRDFGDDPVLPYTASILHPGDAWGFRMKWHLPLDQVGPAEHYMDGTPFREDIVTAPYVISWEAFEERIAEATPEYWRWMHDADMKEHIPPSLERFRRDNPMIASWMSLRETAES